MFALVSMWQDLTFFPSSCRERRLAKWHFDFDPSGQPNSKQARAKALPPSVFIGESKSELLLRNWCQPVISNGFSCGKKQSLSCKGWRNKDSSHPVAWGGENSTISLGIHSPIRKVKCFTSSVVFSLEALFFSLQETLVHKFACLFPQMRHNAVSVLDLLT